MHDTKAEADDVAEKADQKPSRVWIKAGRLWDTISLNNDRGRRTIDSVLKLDPWIISLYSFLLFYEIANLVPALHVVDSIDRWLAGALTATSAQPVSYVTTAVLILMLLKLVTGRTELYRKACWDAGGEERQMAGAAVMACAWGVPLLLVLLLCAWRALFGAGAEG